VDNTLTGVIPPGDVNSPEMNAAESVTTKKRDVKNTWKLLGSTTALLIALGAVVEQGAGLGKAITDLFYKVYPAPSEWTEDKPIVIEPSEKISPLTIQICGSTPESGESMHIAYLLGDDKGTLPPAFILKKKSCRGENGRVWMNSNDFAKYITQSQKANFKLSYTRAHLYSLDQLVSDALNYCGAETPIDKATGGNQS